MPANIYLLAFGYTPSGEAAIFTHVNQQNTGPR